MAFRAKPGITALILAFICCCGNAGGDDAFTLEKAQSRAGADFTPAYEGATVTVLGTVITPPVWAVDGYLVGIRDSRDFGIAMHGRYAQFEKLAPGDRIEAAGTIMRRAGMPVLAPSTIQKTDAGPPPAPVSVDLGRLASFRYLGLAVTTEGHILEISSGDTGDSILIGTRYQNVTVVRYKTRNDVVGNTLGAFDVGDRVRVTGLAAQYCPLPPYNKSYRIVVYDPVAVVRVARRPLIPPVLLLCAVAGLALILSVWWIRDHRRKTHRRALRSLNALSEEIIAAQSPSEILKKLADVIPQVSGATGVRLYVYNRKSRGLDRVPSAAEPEPVSINLESPSGPLATGAALAFRNETVVNIPDTRRSPYVPSGERAGLPRSVMFVPMLAQSETMGVLEVSHAGGIRYFTHEEQAATQHVANQVGASLKLQEQHSMREQLFRSEKLAATGQLISGVANELRSPLENILVASSKLSVRAGEPGLERELRVLAAEAQRASEIVARLVSFGRGSEAEPRPIELNGLIRGLTQFREREWKAAGIVLEDRLSTDPLYTTGAQGQLEQVFLNILVHAEQCALDAGESSISVSSCAIGSHALVEFRFPSSEAAENPFEAYASKDTGGGLALGVARGVLRNHGGDVRYVRPSSKTSRIEVELPIASAEARSEASSPRRSGRMLTTLLVEPDAGRQRALVRDLTARAHRVVPVVSAEEALDLVQRLRFDLIVCSSRLPGLNWVEFLERTQGQTGGFVLFADGMDGGGEAMLRSANGRVLRSLNAADLDRVMRDAEASVVGEAAAQ